jgi:hypothetical protein
MPFVRDFMVKGISSLEDEISSNQIILVDQLHLLVSYRVQCNDTARNGWYPHK